MSEREAKEQFEILYKSAQGKGLEVLLKEILAHPAIFIFSEFVEWPKIKHYLASEEGSNYRRMVDIFRYGSYRDLVEWKDKDSVGEISLKLVSKMRQLTVLSEFEQSRVSKKITRAFLSNF